jgi:hypothetical protein
MRNGSDYFCFFVSYEDVFGNYDEPMIVTALFVIDLLICCFMMITTLLNCWEVFQLANNRCI